MPSVARATRTSEQIRAEIEQAFGFLPPFFEPALVSPQVLGNLWQQTLSAYVENPLSALFKEKLNALLSRFCAAPYCIIVHSSALRPLGMTARQVLALLEVPPADPEATLPLGGLPVPASEEAAAPTPDSLLEKVLLYCATSVFLEQTDAEACRAELRRLLGAALYPHLVAYLAYIKTCHAWIEAHPEVSYEADKRARDNLGPLLAEEPALGDFLRHYQERVGAQRLGREERRAADESLRAEQARTTDILESITDGFHAVDREWRFTYLNAEAERLISRPRQEMLGKNLWEVFPEAFRSTFGDQYRRAMSEGVPVSFEEFYAPLDVWLEVRAYPSASGLSVFFQNVSGRKRVEAERERLLAEQRAQAEREAILNRIGQAIRSASDPEAVQEAAVSLLGEALGADRCYFAAYDLVRGVVTIARDWHRAGLSSLQGVYPFPNTVEMFHELYHGSATSVVGDALTAPLSAQTRANMEGLRLRSRVSAALVDGEGLMATLTAAMADGPREWTGEEVALVEAVATQLRTAVEMARVIQREHNIAQQLQTALQPDLPGTVPGLAVDKYYKAALAEAGVGGDFYDVYALEKGCTALVVGDLSGKGLAAAAQVSVVRNMLRAFLYSRPSVGEAVTELNRVLAENNLLTGFTTLFVGTYDSATRLLKYVNCGQEPALVWRAGTGAVEPLPPTGPILGAIEGARYAESSVALGTGDTVAIFTDGLTEVGARSDMLGIEGVSDLLARAVLGSSAASAQQRAEALALDLITGVGAYAQSAVQDDMCLLVGVVH